MRECTKNILTQFILAILLRELIKQVEPLEKVIVLADDCLAILKEIEDFKKKLPIIRALCTEGLQARHIEQIKIVLEMENYTGEESLSSLVTEDGHKDKLEDIADTASKEFSNERILKNMFRDWEPLEFTPSDCKGTYKLGGDSIELIQQTLDDHLIKTQTMKGSPYARYFLDEIIKWEDQLIKTQENVEMWLKV